MNTNFAPDTYQVNQAYRKDLENHAAHARQSQNVEKASKRNLPNIAKVISQIVLLVK